MGRLNLAKHDIAIGHRQRPAAAITRRARIRSRRIGPDAIALTIEMQNRTTARGDSVNRHHRRAQTHTRDLRVEFALEFSREMRDIGRGAAHVEADQFVESGGSGRLHHADNAAGRAGKDGILAVKLVCVGQAAVRLHEHQSRIGQFSCDAINITPQYRRKISIDNRRIATRNDLHHRADFMRNRYLRETDFARETGNAPLVLGKAISVHEDNRNCPETLIPRGFQGIACLDLVQRRHHFAMCTDALIDFGYVGIEQFRQRDLAIKNTRAVLISDPQLIAKSTRDEERGGFALALKQRIGRHGRPHFHAVDLRNRYRCACGNAKQMANAGECGILVLLRIVRKQLVREQRAVRRPGDDVGEGAAAVNPELPAGICLDCGWVHFAFGCC